MFPQQEPQSIGHDAHVSEGSHCLSPQEVGQRPQSVGQILQLSPWAGSQTLLPQHLPQSSGQDLQSSLALARHCPSPHVAGHLPQSCGQLEHDSLASHVASPQEGFVHCPQSRGHVAQVSLG